MNNTPDIEESDEHWLCLILTCELSLVMRMSAVSIANFVICLRDCIESTMFHL
jgi:hypothetical protein